MMMLKNSIPFHQSLSSLSGSLKDSFHLRIWYLLHCHAAESVLTSGWSVISQPIWNISFIVLPILGMCIKIQNLSIGKWSVYIHISRWRTFYFGALTFLTIIRWRWWCSRQRWSQLWWRCTSFFALPLGLRIPCCGILVRMVAIDLIFTNHCQVTFHCCFYLFICKKLNTSLLHLADFGVKFVD